jgi:glycosyltransferase involved in cell wall biosynthesis
MPVALLVRRICGGGLHLVVHGIDAWKPSRNRVANACVRRINGFISVSNVTKRRFMRWSHLRDDQGIVLPNCVDLSAFTPGPKSGALLDRYHLRGKKVILTLGRLASEERYKGFDEVLEVMPSLIAQIPNLCYLICGDGQDRNRLVKKAKSLGLSVWENVESTKQKAKIEEFQLSSLPASGPPTANRPPLSAPNVIFAGRISDAEKADHYRLADVYLMPGSGEGFGIVYLEALACGVPVIGSKADGSREALLNGRLGALVDPRDPQEIISAVLNILKPEKGGGRRTEVGSPFPANGHSVDYFSTGQFERRLHDILDCIAG